MKDKSKLHKKTITNKKGHRQSVWVKTHKEKSQKKEKKAYVDNVTGKEHSAKEVEGFLAHYESGNVPKKGRKDFESFFKRVGVTPKNKGVKQSLWGSIKPKVEAELKAIGSPKEFNKDILFIEKQIALARASKMPRDRDDFWSKFAGPEFNYAMNRVGNPVYDLPKKYGLNHRTNPNFKWWKKLQEHNGTSIDWSFGDALA